MAKTMRRGRRIITLASAAALAAGIALTGGGVAGAADRLPADAAGTDTTEVVDVNGPDDAQPGDDTADGDETAVRGEAVLGADDATASDAPDTVGLQAANLPYFCLAKVDYPHNSHTTRSTINVHFDTNCRQVAPNLSTEGALYRSRWYGWEHLTTSRGGKSNSRSLRVVAPKHCSKDSWYRYRGEARFYVSGPQGRGSAYVYNQNDKEIKCTG